LLQRTHESSVASLTTKLGDMSIAPGPRHSFTKKKKATGILEA
jgi:hypothetical protein